MTGGDTNPWGPPGQGEHRRAPASPSADETFPQSTPEPDVGELVDPYAPAHLPDIDPKPFEKASPMLSWGNALGPSPPSGDGEGSASRDRGPGGGHRRLRGRLVLLALVALALIAIAAASTLLGGGSGPTSRARTKIAPTQVTGTSPDIAKPKEITAKTAEDQLGDGHVGLRVTHRQLLRTRPAASGRLIVGVGSKTPYGGPNVLPIVKARGDWVAVVSPYRKNNKVAWTKVQPGSKFVAVEYSISIRLSKHTIVVRKNGKIVHRFNTAIGRLGHATPKGRFSVTDGLIFKVGDRAIYGCCALVLSARQPDLPAGWTGGDRIAMHGTPDQNSIGLAASLGCLRVGDEASRWLVRKVPAGATVFIKA